MTGEFIRSREELRTPEWELDLTPEVAGWTFSGLRIGRLDPGASRVLSTGGEELLLFPLEGALEVEVAGETHALARRADVFSGPPDVLYVPPGTSAEVRSAAGGRFAVASARAERVGAVQLRRAADIPVETRGSGTMARQVRDLGAVGVIEAQRLIVCEVITPRGNWSSYPPHKHDTDSAHESELEELYYFEASESRARAAIGYARLQASDARPLDATLELRDGDTVLVPYGWHGPVIAGPTAELYQLNVMAGPGERRWQVTDHPDHGWVRSTW